MEYLEGIGEFMEREGILELEILDGDCTIKLRRGAARSEGAATAPGDRFVSASLAGVVHLSARPGDPLYVLAGHRVERGDVLFCIEAMKHINEVRAEYDLLVVEVLVEEYEAVEEGQAILRVSEEGRD